MRAPSRVAPALQIVLILGAVTLLAGLIPTHPALAIAVAVLVLVLGIVLAAPSLVLALVFATTFAYWRVGPSTLNMSVCDAATLLAMLAAFPWIPWQSRALRRVLAGLAFYLALIAVALAANPTDRAIAEWFHRGVLFGGAVVVGAAVAHRRETAIALKAFLLAAAGVALGAIYESVTTGFEPSFPFGMHKNAAGSLLAIAIIVLVVAPSRLGMQPLTTRMLRILLIVGLIATQSRGAALALVVAICIHALRHRRGQRAPLFLLILSIALIVGSVITLNDELKTNPKFNAIESRTDAFDIAINDVWLQRPFVGGGLRWFQTNDLSNTGIHNEVIAELSEVGLIGLAGFVVLIGNTLFVLRRRRGPIGDVALLVFAFLFLFALTEIFWVAGTLTLTMLIAGLALGEDRSRGVESHADTVGSVAT